MIKFSRHQCYQERITLLMMQKSIVRYQISPKHPAAHLFEVHCTFIAPHPNGQIVSLPSWTPGSYLLREFARNIVSLRAETEGHAVEVIKLDKARWRCAPLGDPHAPLTIIYVVYAWDLSVRTAHLDTTHAYFNGASVFLQVQGGEDRSCEVDIQPPRGEAYTRWRVGTALPRLSASPYGFGTYREQDYDALIDHPVEIGDFALVHFEAGGVPHDIIIYGRQRADLARLTRDLRRVCEQHIALFGTLPAMARYVFLVMAVGEGGGGLEHRTSTSLLCKRTDLPRHGETDINDGYRGFLGLCSHEYFHTWNIKRIKPAAFLPYDLSRENYTRQLWAFEGITSYYDDLGLVRSGLISLEDYLELLGQTATRVWRGSGRFNQSIAESSFDAWTKFYRQDENAPNAIVSYYTKGALVALALDLTLRACTGDARSLDDLMRALWTRYGEPGMGVPEGGIEGLASEIAGQALDTFFTHYVHGTEDPPLASLLARVGVHFRLCSAAQAKDSAGTPDGTLARQGYLGVRTARDASGARLVNVFTDSAAQQAGLSAGDIIIAIDGLRAAKDNLDALITAWPIGSTVTVHAFRRDELMTFEVTLQASPDDTCVFTLDHGADEATLARRCAWLGQTG